MVKEPLDRLVKVEIAHVVQDLGDEPEIYQVAAGVLGAANIQVNREPLVDGFFAERLFGVDRV